MKRSKIAVFDSGVGGITLLHRLMKVMPREDYLYYADSAHTPYGDRPSHEVKSFFETAISRLAQVPLKAIVVACNLISVELISQLQARYSIPIIGMQPANKPVIRDHDPRKILVIGSTLALKQSKLASFISNLQTGDIVDTKPMQELVDYAEEFDFDSPELKRYLKKKFNQVNWQSYHSLVLGCTHFLYFRTLISGLIPAHIHIIDGHAETVQKIMQMIQQENMDRSYSLQCQLSGKEVATEIIMPYLNLVDRNYIQLEYWGNK